MDEVIKKSLNVKHEREKILKHWIRFYKIKDPIDLKTKQLIDKVAYSNYLLWYRVWAEEEEKLIRKRNTVIPNRL